MPQCRKCNKIFQRFQDFNGKKIDCRRRKYCLECHPKTGPLGKYGVTGEGLPKIDRICNICNRHFKVKTRNNTCSTCRMRIFRHQQKEKMYCIKGNKCSICGYDKCKDALDLHHMNKDDKKFSISSFWGHKSWDELEKELEKCILICSNCHRELHSKDRNKLSIT